MTGVQRRVSARIPVAVEDEIERKRAHPIWTLFIFLAFLAAAYSGFFFYDMMRMEMGKADQPSGVTHGTAKWVLDKFYEDPKWTKYHLQEYPEGKQPPFVDNDPRIKHWPVNELNGPTFHKPFTASSVTTDAAAPAPAPAANP